MEFSSYYRDQFDKTHDEVGRKKKKLLYKQEKNQQSTYFQTILVVTNLKIISPDSVFLWEKWN